MKIAFILENRKKGLSSLYFLIVFDLKLKKDEVRNMKET